MRGVIEQKLDVLVPISHQPRELITDIIADSSTKFPEFASCVRKRVRTFLKSYRRSKKIKEVTVSPAQNGVNSGGPKVSIFVLVWALSGCVCVWYNYVVYDIAGTSRRRYSECLSPNCCSPAIAPAKLH